MTIQAQTLKLTALSVRVNTFDTTNQKWTFGGVMILSFHDNIFIKCGMTIDASMLANIIHPHVDTFYTTTRKSWNIGPAANTDDHSFAN
jgi:hypothetical protein